VDFSNIVIFAYNLAEEASPCMKFKLPKQSLGNDERTNFKITTSLMMKKYLAAFKEKPLGLK
jgi:hypothetical protein